MKLRMRFESLGRLIGRYRIKFLELRTSRKISIAIYALLILSMQIFAIAAIVNVIAFSEVISNIQFPSGHIYINIDTSKPEEMALEIPYYIKNHGYSDLSEISFSLQIFINFINYTDHANLTYQIFSKFEQVGICRALSIREDIFSGEYSDFDISVLNKIHRNYDDLEEVILYLNFELHASYFLNILKISLAEKNVEI